MKTGILFLSETIACMKPVQRFFAKVLPEYLHHDVRVARSLNQGLMWHKAMS